MRHLSLYTYRNCDDRNFYHLLFLLNNVSHAWVTTLTCSSGNNSNCHFLLKFKKIHLINNKYINFSFGCMHPPTVCRWAHWHPGHTLSQRLWKWLLGLILFPDEHVRQVTWRVVRLWVRKVSGKNFCCYNYFCMYSMKGEARVWSAYK